MDKRLTLPITPLHCQRPESENLFSVQQRNNTLENTQKHWNGWDWWECLSICMYLVILNHKRKSQRITKIITLHLQRQSFTAMHPIVVFPFPKCLRDWLTNMTIRNGILYSHQWKMGQTAGSGLPALAVLLTLFWPRWGITCCSPLQLSFKLKLLVTCCTVPELLF